MIFRQKLLLLLNHKGITQAQLAQRLAVRPGTVSGWLSGKQKIRMKNLKRVAEILNVPPEWLMDDEQNYPPPGLETETAGLGLGFKLIPVFDVGAGYRVSYDDAGRVVGQTEHDPILVPIRDPNAFGCMVRGDSMAPEFPDGSIVVFDTQLTPVYGKPMLVIWEDGGVQRSAFKLVYDAGDALRLVALNPETEAEKVIPKSTVRRLFIPRYVIRKL